MKRKPNETVAVGRCAKTGLFLSRAAARRRKASALVERIRVSRGADGRYR